MRLFDLSMTIHPHWRWSIGRDFLQSHARGDGFQSSTITCSMHSFTHVDTPLHMLPGQITIEKVGLENFVGPAAVLDLSPTAPNRAITREVLARSGRHIKPGDIVILKTGWDLLRSWDSREFWTEAPYLEDDAASWLADLPIKAVGFDFPQDYRIRDIPARHPAMEELTTHHIILRKGIYLIEYLCNVHSVPGDRVTLAVLPLKVEGAEGAPARAVAILDP